MIFAAHQPNYLPWLGYFYKIMKSDVFILLDDVQFEKRGYQNRVRVKSQSGPQWLTQPVLQKNKQLTSDVLFSPSINWREKHLNQIRSNYGRAPHFKSVIDTFTEWLNTGGESQAEFNIGLIEGISHQLGARATFVRSSTFGVSSTGSKRLAELGQHVGGSIYLSGRGGQAYQDENDFFNKGQKLSYTRFAEAPYPQLHGDFVGGLSVIDAIFNLGFDDLKEILEKAEDPI